MSKKKKVVIITSIVIVAFIVMGIVYALLSDNSEVVNKIKVGTVRIDSLNLQLKDSKGNQVEIMSPADIDTLSWTTKNIGTSGVLSRHTLEIYWDDDVKLYMYPANMSDDAIISDFENINAGGESAYLIKTEPTTVTVGDKSMNALKYNFIGDNLNGADGTDVSKEVNYNSDNEEIIDASIKTDDSSKTQDDIAFKILLSPKTSYLNQGKKIYARVTTEAMQYTEDGSADWKVVDVVELDD